MGSDGYDDDDDEDDISSGLRIVRLQSDEGGVGRARRKRTGGGADDDDDVSSQLEDESMSVSTRDLRSQRLSDTYPIRMGIVDQSNGLFTRLYRRVLANYLLQPMIHLLFPRVLQNKAAVQLLGFRTTTQVKLLCPWTCADGHICQYYEGHTGPHKCVFNHAEGAPIRKCPHVCDCRHCEGRCIYPPGHSGIHKCHFRHYPRDVPGSRAEQEAFRDDKAIGDYIEELAYSTPEDIKFSHIPETLDPRDESWTEGS